MYIVRSCRFALLLNFCVCCRLWQMKEGLRWCVKSDAGLVWPRGWAIPQARTLVLCCARTTRGLSTHSKCSSLVPVCRYHSTHSLFHFTNGIQNVTADTPDRLTHQIMKIQINFISTTAPLHLVTHWQWRWTSRYNGRVINTCEFYCCDIGKSGKLVCSSGNYPQFCMHLHHRGNPMKL